MQPLVSTRPQSVSRCGTRPSEHAADSSGGYAVQMSLGRSVARLSNPLDPPAPHCPGEVLSRKADGKQLLPSGDAAENVDAVSKVCHPRIVGCR